MNHFIGKIHLLSNFSIQGLNHNSKPNLKFFHSNCYNSIPLQYINLLTLKVTQCLASWWFESLWKWWSSSDWIIIPAIRENKSHVTNQLVVTMIIPCIYPIYRW